MEVLVVSPEVVPFSKVGGIADVVGALPKALRALGHKVTVLSLRYGSVDATTHALARRLAKLPVPLGDEVVQSEIYEARLPSGVNVTLLNAPGLTDRAAIYGEADDAKRFAFLSRAAVEWARTQGTPPDVIHAHDWTTGLVALFLKEAARTDARLKNVRCVFTVHDVTHQGLVALAAIRALGVPESTLQPTGIEFWGQASTLKAGLVYADRVCTGSPSFAKEIATPEGGYRMDGVIRARGREVVGILNGIDYAIWNPATDPTLGAHFDAEDIGPKARCKVDLQTRCGLAVRPGTPLIGMVARLEERKGIDILAAAAPRLLRHDLQLVVLGDGEERFATMLTDLAKRFPDRVFFKQGFDDELAHRVYAATDFFLAPSRSESDGLGHLYAMRYGSVPIARSTGSIRDTIVDCDSGSISGTGFLFDLPNEDEFAGAVGRALLIYRDTDAMSRLRHRAMRRDFSWDRSARQYQSVFASLIANAQRAEASPAPA